MSVTGGPCSVLARLRDAGAAFAESRRVNDFAVCKRLGLSSIVLDRRSLCVMVINVVCCAHRGHRQQADIWRARSFKRHADTAAVPCWTGMDFGKVD
jgi:hypothetical protein